MNKNLLEIIRKGNLEQGPLTEEEKEIALKILNDLEGTLVIRATSILELCLKAIQYSGIGTANFKTLNQETAPEVPVQEHPIVKVKITNMNELNELILKANKIFNEIKHFKFKIKSYK